jgi:hypothetical protein
VYATTTVYADEALELPHACPHHDSLHRQRQLFFMQQGLGLRDIGGVVCRAYGPALQYEVHTRSDTCLHAGVLAAAFFAAVRLEGMYFFTLIPIFANLETRSNSGCVEPLSDALNQ